MPNPPIPTFPARPPEGSAPWQTADYQRALALSQARVRELEGLLRGVAALESLIVPAGPVKPEHELEAIALTKMMSDIVAALAGVRMEAERIAHFNLCDICAGSGKPENCACGGTGRMSDAVTYMRKRLAEVEMARDADRGERGS